MLNAWEPVTCFPRDNPCCKKGRRGAKGDVGCRGDKGPRGEKGCRGDSCAKGILYGPDGISFQNAMASSFPQIFFTLEGEVATFALQTINVMVPLGVPTISISFQAPKDVVLDINTAPAVVGTGIDLTTFQGLILLNAVINTSTALTLTYVSNSGTMISPGSYQLYGTVVTKIIRPCECVGSCVC